MSKYRISMSIDGENFFWVIVDKGIFIRNTTKEDLMGTKLKYYNKTNICHRCRYDNNITDKSILYPGNACHEKDKDRKETGEWICFRHWNKDDSKFNPNSQSNIMKSLANHRTGNLDPNCNTAKAFKSQELACILYEWIDLNKENDNYSNGAPIDCYDPKTGLYHQVQVRYYDIERGYWPFTGFKDEWGKIFEDMICFCVSADGNIVERIYKFSWKVIMERTGATIYKNPIDCWHNPVTPGWYKEYRIVDKDELKKANNIWNKIL